MGYSKGFIASIIIKGKPQREFKYGDKRTVKVPFGSEYILRLKNKSKDPAIVEVTIDGTDVLNGSDLVLEAGQTIDLERFVDDLDTGKKFKFISLEEGASSGEIDDPYREENGLIKVKFYKAFYSYFSAIYGTPFIDSYPPSFCGAVINTNGWLSTSNSPLIYSDGPSITTTSGSYVSDVSSKSVS